MTPHPPSTTLQCMEKSEVYSWRLTPAMKAALEETAQRERESVAALLDRIVRLWLEAAEPSVDADGQRRVRTRARRCFGAMSGGNPKRSVEAGALVRARLAKRRAN